MLPSFTPDLCETVILQLQPRYVYRLMQTNKYFYDICKNHEVYWARVALYLIWSPERRWPHEMVLLPFCYSKAMSTFIQTVRDDVLNDWDRPDIASQPVEKLLEFAQLMLEFEGFVGRPIIPGQTAFQIVQRFVEDTDNLPNAMQRASEGMDVPRRTGFITASRRAKRATSKFLRVLEDEDGMDLRTKLKIKNATRELIDDITERRGRSLLGPLRFELYEEDIDASHIFL